MHDACMCVNGVMQACNILFLILLEPGEHFISGLGTAALNHI